MITNFLISLILFELLTKFKCLNIRILINSNPSIIFSLLYKLLKLMHLDTGCKEIVFRKVFSPKKIKTETTYYYLIIFSQLIDLRIEGKSKSFLHNVSKYSKSIIYKGFG
jgi:hypothetical protein